MTAPLLQAEGVTVGYGPIEVLKGVSLAIPQGGTLAIIGPNGAGKSTLFKALTGEIACRSGRIHFRGQDVTAMRAHMRTALGMGRTFQTSRIFPEFTVFENLVTAVEARERSARRPQGPWWRWRIDSAIADEAAQMLARLGLAPLAKSTAGALSHGDKKRLELALTLALQPAILMLDEPTAGMAPSDRGGIVALIRQLRAESNLSLLITEHDMDVIFTLADSVLVMNYGEVIAHGSVEQVRQDPVVREVYLGQEMYHAAG